jgi:hypothetical protein
MSPSRSIAPSSQALARLVVPLVLASLAVPALALSQTAAPLPVRNLSLSAGAQASAITPLPPGDKTPQQSTSGPAVALSPERQAAIAAKPSAALPAPDAGVATAAEKAAGSSVAPIPPDASINGRPISGATLAATHRDPVASPVMTSGVVRRSRASSAWTTSPSLGDIPRLNWRIPSLVKPQDMIWIATPEGGRQVPVTPASGGER